MASQMEQWIAGSMGPGARIPGVSPEAARRARIATFQDRAQQFPGVMGNGPTGVNAGDSHGYNDMLTARRQFEDDLNAEEGKGPMDVRSAPMVERHSDAGADALGPLQGLRMAMRGGNYAGGGGGDVDDNGAGRTQRLANAVRQRDLEEELTNPSSARPSLGQNLSDDELHAASANDFLTKAHAKTAGETYYMPEVAGPRNEDIATKMGMLQRQYIDPANIKADADVASAQLGYEGQNVRAAGQENAARLSGAASIRAAQENAGGRRSAADADLLGKLSQYDMADPKQLQQLLGLIKAMREQGVIR